LPGAKWFELWRLQAAICRKVFIRDGLSVKNFILNGLAASYGSLARFMAFRRQFVWVSGCGLGDAID
jgi:hypothetical protein